MKPIQELQRIFDSVHNTNSTATKPVEQEPQKETWFDKLVLRWF